MDKIYTATVDDIREEMKLLRERLVRTKSLSETHLCLASIYNLNDLYKFIAGSDLVDFEKFCYKNRNRVGNTRDFGLKQQSVLMKSFIENKELISYISVMAYNMIAEKLREYDNDDQFVITELFPEEDAQFLIFNFFQEFHPDDRELFERMIKERRMFSLNNLSTMENSNNLRGQCINMYKTLPFIVTQSPFYTLETISFLVHEFGHAVDLMDLGNSFTANQIEKYFLGSFNDETIAKLYEREILDFFIQHEINSEAAADLLKDYHGITSDALLEVHFLAQLPDGLLKNDNYKFCSKETLMSYVGNESLKEVVDYNIDFSNLDIYEAVKYATGGIVAPLLYERLMDDPKEGRKIYQGYLNERCRPFTSSFIEMLQYREGEFSDIIEKDFKMIRKYKNSDCLFRYYVV